MIKTGSLTDLLLASARSFRGGEFTQEELIVRAWRYHKDAFGLDGFKADYPDSNKVIVNLCGNRGLVARGYLRKLGPKRYVVSRGIPEHNGNGHAKGPYRVRTLEELVSCTNAPTTQELVWWRHGHKEWAIRKYRQRLAALGVVIDSGKAEEMLGKEA
jgi:hypothetical protein